jgi:hypothetical protein
MQSFVDEKYYALAYYTLGLQDECFIHQYMVDAYTAQTANSDTKPIALTFALVGIYLHIEKNYSGKEVQAFHTLMSNKKIKWPIFELPTNRGEISIDMVIAAEIEEERNKMIQLWCNSIWMAFSANHKVVKEIADYYL